MQSEDIDIVIDGKVQTWMGNPARISVDPITLSADRETLYYGPMNGYTWYQFSSLRDGRYQLRLAWHQLTCPPPPR